MNYSYIVITKFSSKDILMNSTGIIITISQVNKQVLSFCIEYTYKAFELRKCIHPSNIRFSQFVK